MVEEDLDLTKTCPSCASPNVSTDRKGQTICRDCGTIVPAGKVFGFGIYSKIKGIFDFTKTKAKKKAKKIKKEKRKQGKLKKIKSILKKKKIKVKKKIKKKTPKKKKLEGKKRRKR